MIVSHFPQQSDTPLPPSPFLQTATIDTCDTLSMEELKTKVINIKPETDFISSIGDVVPNRELVQCRKYGGLLLLLCLL